MNNKHVLKVVLTGGPMAGKSSILIYLKNFYKHEIQIIPEIATSLQNKFFNDEIFFSKLLNKDLSRLFFNFQEQLESVYLKTAKQKKTKLIVCDRGLFDGAAYYNGNVKDFLIANKTTSKKIYERYDVIIWLETLIITNKNKGFTLRPLIKNKERLVLKISNNNLKHWKSHQNFYSVKGDTLEEKKVAVMHIINSFLEKM